MRRTDWFIVRPLAVLATLALAAGNGRAGTTVHFEKELDWVPGAPGEHLINTDR